MRTNIFMACAYFCAIRTLIFNAQSAISFIEVFIYVNRRHDLWRPDKLSAKWARSRPPSPRDDDRGHAGATGPGVEDIGDQWA